MDHRVNGSTENGGLRLLQNALWGALDRPNLAISRTNLSPERKRQLVADLSRIVGSKNVWGEREKLLAYSYDATGERHLPDVAVFVDRARDLGAVLKTLGTFGLPVIGRGAGTNLSGGTTPISGGAILAFSRLNAIRAIDPENLCATVEPGVVNADFQEALSPHHLFFAPDPGSHRIATLGGNVAENSGGPHCVKYGVTTNHVLGGECYLADGSRVAMPTTRDWRSELDVTGLITGSEGTLAVISSIDVQLVTKPEAVETLLAAFDDLDKATEAVSAMIRARITPSTLELLDRATIETVERFAHAGYPDNAEAVLLIEVDGSGPAAEIEHRRVQEILQQQGAITVSRATTPEEVELLWKGRRSAYGAAAQISSHIWVQDVTVPRPLLPEMMRIVNRIGHQYGLTILILAHAGDGNLHPNIAYDPANPDEVERLRLADHEILRECVRLGGSITGEHGIGIDKLEHMALMYGPAERKVMWELKTAFDPELRLNPYKAVLPDSYTATQSPRDETVLTGTVRTLQETIRQLSDEKGKAIVHGTQSRFPLAPSHRGSARAISTREMQQIWSVDEGNLTVEVDAGVRAVDLAAALAEKGFAIPALPEVDRSVGGLVASNARHWGHSGLGWRDWVLLVEIIDGRGRLLRFGRQTMKNVAGYDVAKLLVGSWGQIGLITRVVFRLRPLPQTRLVGRVQSTASGAMIRLVQDLRQFHTPPTGLLFHHRDVNQLWILAAGSDLDFRRGAYGEAARHRGLDVVWDDRAEATAEIDRTHEQSVRTALTQRRFAEGGMEPTQFGPVLQQGLGSECWWFPFSGSVEITAWDAPPDVLANPWMRRSLVNSSLAVVRDPGWRTVEDAICRVFDPDRVFPRFTQEGDQNEPG